MVQLEKKGVQEGPCRLRRFDFGLLGFGGTYGPSGSWSTKLICTFEKSSSAVTISASTLIKSLFGLKKVFRRLSSVFCLWCYGSS